MQFTWNLLSVPAPPDPRLRRTSFRQTSAPNVRGADLCLGVCRRAVTGRFRGANFPRRQGADGPFRPDFRAVIEADDGAVIMVEWHGYGRAYPPGRRQIVGSVFHLADREPYRRLNDVLCVCIGEVRTPRDPGQSGPDLVIDVAEVIWGPIAD